MSSTKSINLMFWNAQGVTNSSKQLELSNYVSVNGFDIVMIGETFLNCQQHFTLPNFIVYRSDRHTHGGGVALAIRNHLHHEFLGSFPTVAIENTAVRIKINGKSTLIIVAYNPRYTSNFTNDIVLLTSPDEEFIIMGDLNAKHTAWNCAVTDRSGLKLMNEQANGNFLIHHPPNPTHFPHSGRTPSTIDILLTNSSNVLSDITADEALNSDHFPISCTVIGGCSTEAPNIFYDYKQGNWANYARTLQDRIANYAQISSTADVDDTINLLSADMIDARNANIPTKHAHEPLTRLSDNTLNSIATRNMVRRRWQRAHRPGEKNALKALLNQWNKIVKRQCLEDRNANWNNKLESLGTGSKKYWQITKAIRGKNKSIPSVLKTDDTTATTDQEKSDMLAESFVKANRLTHNDGSPIAPQVNLFMSAFVNSTSTADSFNQFTCANEMVMAVNELRPFKAPGTDGVLNIMLKKLPTSAILLLVVLFNRCIALGHWPAAFKTAKVIAIPKAGKNPNCAGSYRPISLLSATGKLFEKLLLTRIKACARAKNIVRHDQFGFKPEHSTTHQLCRVKKKIKAEKSARRSTGLLLLDYEKAFDTVWHAGLIYKLHRFGFPHHILKLIYAFCSNRQFAVHVNSAKSTCKVAVAGLGQGSVLSPELFGLYIADLALPECVMSALYADDTAIIASSNHGNSVIRKLQMASDILVRFLQEWKIKLNVNKTQLLFFPYDNRARRLPTTTLKIANSTIPLSKEATYLGVIFDTKLKFNSHLESVKAKALRCLRAVFPMMCGKAKLSKKNKFLLYKGIIRPLLTYAAPVWIDAPIRAIYGLQVIQNKCLKIILRLTRRFPTELLHEISNFPTINELLATIRQNFLDKCAQSDHELIREICD